MLMATTTTVLSHRADSGGAGHEGQGWTGPGRLLEEDGLELGRKDA